MTLAEKLDGWLCFADPLPLEDGEVDHPVPMQGSRLRTTSTSGPKLGSRIADEGRSQWIVDSTPFEELGTMMSTREPIVPEAAKRSRLSSHISTLYPTFHTHTPAHAPQCECIGKRRRRWRIRQSRPRHRPYRRPSGMRRRRLQQTLSRKLYRSSGAYPRCLQSARSLLEFSIHATAPKLEPKVTTTSNARNQCGLPGPKSGLRLLLFFMKSITLTGGVRVPVPAGAGAPKPTGHVGPHVVGKHAPGGIIAPVN